MEQLTVPKPHIDYECLSLDKAVSADGTPNLECDRLLEALKNVLCLLLIDIGPPAKPGRTATKSPTKGPRPKLSVQ